MIKALKLNKREEKRNFKMLQFSTKFPLQSNYSDAVCNLTLRTVNRGRLKRTIERFYHTYMIKTVNVAGEKYKAVIQHNRYKNLTIIEVINEPQTDFNFYKRIPGVLNNNLNT